MPGSCRSLLSVRTARCPGGRGRGAGAVAWRRCGGRGSAPGPGLRRCRAGSVGALPASAPAAGCLGAAASWSELAVAAAGRWRSWPLGLWSRGHRDVHRLAFEQRRPFRDPVILDPSDEPRDQVRPSSGWVSSRPRKRTVTLIRSPSSRNSTARWTFVSKAADLRREADFLEGHRALLALGFLLASSARTCTVGQYKYELTKREKEAKRKQRSVTFKEVRLSPKIGTGDFDTKVHRAIEFLEDGDRIKVTVRFRGRELTHPELGRNLIARFADRVKDHGVPERTPLLEGKSMHITMASIHKPKGHDAPPARGGEGPRLGRRRHRRDRQQRRRLRRSLRQQRLRNRRRTAQESAPPAAPAKPAPPKAAPAPRTATTGNRSPHRQRRAGGHKDNEIGHRAENDERQDPGSGAGSNGRVTEACQRSSRTRRPRSGSA